MNLLIGKNKDSDYQISVSLPLNKYGDNFFFIVNFNLFSGRIESKYMNYFSKEYKGLDKIFERYEIYLYKEELLEMKKILKKKETKFKEKDLINIIIIEDLLNNIIKDMEGNK